MALIWEQVEIKNDGGFLSSGVAWMRRAKVPGGWLISAWMAEGGGITFYPDPTHLWDGHSLP